MSNDQLPGTDYSRITFEGAKYDTLIPDLKIGDEHEFTVRVRVRAREEAEKADGHIGWTIKSVVKSIVPTSFVEPEDPNQPTLLSETGAE